METTAVDERARFARAFVSGQWSMTELCERHGVTRPTGYKWVARYRAGGDDALSDRSRAPHHSPHRIDAVLKPSDRRAREYGGARRSSGRSYGPGIPPRGRHAARSTRCSTPACCR
jgi:hypothetical protein